MESGDLGEPAVSLASDIEHVPPVELEAIFQGLTQIAESHPDELVGSVMITQHMMAFDGYDADGFAAGVCFIKDLLSAVFKQFALQIEQRPQEFFNSVGQAMGWGAAVAIAKKQWDEMEAALDEEE